MSDTAVPSTRPPVGFLPWFDPYRVTRESPYSYEVVEIWNSYTLRRGMMDMREPRHPSMNVANLWWKPVRRSGETTN